MKNTTLSKIAFVCGDSPKMSLTAIRLVRSGWKVMLFAPTNSCELRHHLSFGSALYLNEITIHDIRGLKYNTAVENSDFTITIFPNEKFSEQLSNFKPDVVISDIDQRIFAIHPEMAVLTIGCSDSHIVETDCDLAIETRQISTIGTVYRTKNAEKMHDDAAQFFKTPLTYCKTPLTGTWEALTKIGDTINYNQPLGKVNGIEIRSAYDGQICGLAMNGIQLNSRDSVAIISETLPNNTFKHYDFNAIAVSGSIFVEISAFFYPHPHI